ncbi:enoyl-ACP reductase FabV [Terrisporobacter hibernicus]|uniref:Trans-2-enoyl-CoA reductase [NADH] n=1 Tax=Terrisporobacter hibernicus TaxID=2813371 RepID=A0AAX2ZB27_9FIRM|nr:enoyl-ACP reductase FabV [Terrisporobacter hibernicus]UEL46413.1 trans-2-enoyl-CoA reductase family protein [Terrisporobacter hibernicus]
MKIEAKLVGNVARAAHPQGCKVGVQKQIEYIKEKGKFEGPKKVLILGASSSYGLSSRIALAFGSGADTIGVSFERGVVSEEKMATAGWFNNIYFKEAAEKEGLIAKNFIGDAFSDQMRDQVIDYIKTEFGGEIDLLVYSLASPRRTVPSTGETFASCIKPIGEPVTGYSINLEKGEIFTQTVEPATQEEIQSSIKVMGGEDWEIWINELLKAGVLSDEFKTTLFSYIGPEITQPFYGGGTLGRAKRHAEETSKKLDELLKKEVNGESVVCVSKAVTTKASAVIPILPMYASALYKVMLEEETHETPIMHKYRFFKDMLYGNKREYDEKGMLRPDSWEMKEEVQQKVKEILDRITPENFKDITAVDVFEKEFMQLNGFEFDGVDYDEDFDIEKLKKLIP